jgi:DMSO/TMAO reductase YedYZ molybdopterin-dependent catalytic subunit
VSEDDRVPPPSDAEPAAAPRDGDSAPVRGEVAHAGGAEPPAPGPGPEPAPAPEAAPAVAERETPAPPLPAEPPPPRANAWDERAEQVLERAKGRLAAQSRRDFLLFAVGLLATGAGAWWLLPDRTRARLLPGSGHDRLDTLAARAGLTRGRRERVLDRALTFDDDVAEALYSRNRRVRTYDPSQAARVRNNYNGRTPGPEYLAGWALEVAGLASGRTERLAIGELLGRFALHEQVTRLVCVEGWSAIAWWRGIRFADFLEAFPPAAGARWAALRSSVNLDGAGRPDPYYVSIDLETARHPHALLATHLDGRPLTLEHGAPLRLAVPVKLGLKNIKAITSLEYTAVEPADYWNERGYSKYDGL